MRSRPIEDFWISADGDDWSLALIRAQSALGRLDVLHLKFQPRLYRFTSIDIFRLIHIQGAPGCGMKLVATTAQADDYHQTTFYLSTGGITIHYPTTRFGTGTYTTDPLSDANRPSITDVAFIGPSGTSGSTTFHCINAHRPFTLQNFSIYNFPGDGIHVHATASSSGSTRGNANRCVIERGYIRKCGVNGIFFDGGDSNTAYLNTVDINDVGRNLSAANFTTSGAVIVQDNWNITTTTPTHSPGVSVTVTATAGHNYVTGMYAELVQIDNTTILTSDTDGDGTADYADPVLVWAAGQVTVTGNSFTWSYTGSAPPTGTYKLRTGAGATSVSGSNTSEGEGRIVWFTCASPTYNEGALVTISNINQIPTSVTPVHKNYQSNNLVGLVCPKNTLATDLVTVNTALTGDLSSGGGDVIGNLSVTAAQLYSSSFLSNLYENILFGPTIQGGHYQCYNDSGKSTFVSCYIEGGDSTKNKYLGTGLWVGGTGAVPTTDAEITNDAHMFGSGRGLVRVSRGIEAHTHRYNNGPISRLGGLFDNPNLGFLSFDHSYALTYPMRLMFEFLNSQQCSGYISLETDATSTGSRLDIPHSNNNRLSHAINFPGGMTLTGPAFSTGNSYYTPGYSPEAAIFLGSITETTKAAAADRRTVAVTGTGLAANISNLSNSAGNTLVTHNALSSPRRFRPGMRVLITDSSLSGQNGVTTISSVPSATTVLLSKTFSGTYSSATVNLSAGSYNSTTKITTFSYNTLIGTLVVGDRITLTGSGSSFATDLLVTAKDPGALTLSVRCYDDVSSATSATRTNGQIRQVIHTSYDSCPPQTGQYAVGDLVYNYIQEVPVLGWRCETYSDTAGGTWVPIGVGPYTNGSQECELVPTSAVIRVASYSDNGSSKMRITVAAHTIPNGSRIILAGSKATSTTATSNGVYLTSAATGTTLDLADLSFTTTTAAIGCIMSARAEAHLASYPTDGTWAVGDIVYNTVSTTGILGWVCTVAGTTGGTWKVLTVAAETSLDSGAAYIGQMYNLRCSVTSGAASPTTILDTTPGLPYAIRIIDVSMFVSTAEGGATLTVEDSDGNALSDAMSLTSVGHVRSAAAAGVTGSVTVAAGKGIRVTRSATTNVAEIMISYVIT